MYRKLFFCTLLISYCNNLITQNPSLQEEDLLNALHTICERGHLSTLQSLILHNYPLPPNIFNQPLPRSHLNNTALHVAAFYNRYTCVQQLLHSESMVNSKNKIHATPLHCAAIAGNEKIIKILLAWGADVTAQDICKQTPRDYAHTHGHITVEKILLAHENSKQKKQSNFLPYTAASITTLMILTYLAHCYS